MMFEMSSYNWSIKSKNCDEELWCFIGLTYEERRNINLLKYLFKTIRQRKTLKLLKNFSIMGLKQEFGTWKLKKKVRNHSKKHLKRKRRNLQIKRNELILILKDKLMKTISRQMKFLTFHFWLDKRRFKWSSEKLLLWNLQKPCLRQT